MSSMKPLPPTLIDEKVHETDEDLKNELHIAEQFARYYDCSLHKESQFDHVDLCVKKNGRWIGFVECKARNTACGDYKDVMLEKNKFLKIKDQIKHSKNLPIYFVVWWKKCNTMGRVNLDNYKLQQDNLVYLSPRRDNRDRGTQLLIPINDFEIFYRSDKVN